MTEVFRLNIYSDGSSSYPVSDFDSIVGHIRELIEENDFPEVKVFEVDGYEGEGTQEETPIDTNTLTQVTFEGYGY